MFKKNYLVKINLPGGIVAAGDLYAIVEAAERGRVEEMQFGARQQLFCKIADRYGETFLKELDAAGIFYETEREQYPNIISSYVSEGVFSRSQWMSEGLYKDILDAFDFRPRLKINLVENSQSFVPFFTGHLNFISSAVNNHWHLMVRLPGTNQLYRWKTIVYSPDIPRLSKLIEETLMTGQPIAAAESPVKNSPDAPPLKLNPGAVPYYEGFNRSGAKHWLGIYRREETFPLDFLKDVCLLALHTKIGQLYTTPWKSLLIKGIEEQDLPGWEYTLGKYRINVRHASNELNWQIEDLCPEGLRLKRYLIRQLDQDDVRTEGLTFAIKTQAGSGLAGSIVIRKQQGIRPDQLKMLDRYSIWHTPDFDPYAMEPVLYRKDIEKENLYPYLASLCKEFYRHQNERRPPTSEPDAARLTGKNNPGHKTYRCTHCLTIYDEQFGDPGQDIPAGTPFEKLPGHWTCSVCGGEKTEYAVISGSPIAPASAHPAAVYPSPR